MPKNAPTVCRFCGQIEGNESYDDSLWHLYYLLKDGRQHREGLVFTADWLQENVLDDDDEANVRYAMEKDMHSRGLCIECARPDLRGTTPDSFYTEEEAQDLADMHAEQAAERWAGC